MVAIYQSIGQGYDRTRRADPYIASRLAFHLRTRSSGRYLDIACGTGDYTQAMARIAGAWYGLDESAAMIAEAARKNDVGGWIVGKADCLPCMDDVFAGGICTLAIHHFDALDSAFHEMNRVISDGRLVLFTATPEQVRRYWLTEYFPEAIQRSAEQMPSLDRLTDTLESSGFDLVALETYSIRDDLQDFFLYSGKHRPEIYLDPSVRAGISTFALLASPSEVQDGCRRLAADIDSGAIAQVIERYRHEAGDYIFVVAEAT